ncbi:Protein phosphatase 1M [Varanus komodoensis]|uniref:Protein phosphatase, Mg2+/Mn2+ dependent 1M n=1 Tax=Varanus komodoensis TaxID=61221 RepID=A0A8D2Q6Q2_VARKO|nr:protein phosphatase 1M [Varanus komodoensis]KAF7249653.1 Protein phosphatase 1M [Varanus komodoensis]
MSSDWFKRRFLSSRSTASPRRGAPRQQHLLEGKGEFQPSPSSLLYRRPRFLRAAACVEERQPGRRPVYSSSRDRPLQWDTGYAETINAEKSEFNEDQATCCHISIRKREDGKEEDQEWLILCSAEYLTGYYWALFDGHGGPEAAIMASNYLHYCIKQKLEDVIEGITENRPPMHLSGQSICQSDPQFVEEKQIRQEDLVTGALENAFLECDEVIGLEMERANQSGGCTALVALYLQGKLYVANAGDSRALLVQRQSIAPMSTEFTPESERQRIQHLAFIYPKLLADEFTRLEFPRRLKGDDVGQKVLYRDYSMEGWGYKTVVKDDLKYPLIHGHGKQARLLGTLAVSRGLGDHKLKVIDTDVEVKPFLSCIPKVKILDLTAQNINEDDVLIMATDGLWDVMSNEEVAQTVRNFFQYNATDPNRFGELAKCLVQKARGKKDGYYWTMENNIPASYDDISVFVLPLYNIAKSFYC